MVEATATEIAIASLMILVVGLVLSSVGLLEDAITIFVFMAMGLLGFLTVRVLRGRSYNWR
ncbi:hypothetical protein [Halohasta salina]|uniref:hypothetical protein n=1 Tax=Halohasta salina TaxID=2961621 RepID=UPI0020A45F68|nr:hypothetical protein [Halohasta salina]